MKDEIQLKLLTPESGWIFFAGGARYGEMNILKTEMKNMQSISGSKGIENSYISYPCSC